MPSGSYRLTCHLPSRPIFGSVCLAVGRFPAYSKFTAFSIFGTPREKWSRTPALCCDISASHMNHVRAQRINQHCGRVRRWLDELNMVPLRVLYVEILTTIAGSADRRGHSDIMGLQVFSQSFGVSGVISSMIESVGRWRRRRQRQNLYKLDCIEVVAHTRRICGSGCLSAPRS
jgi:hypothetical protein